MDSLTLALVGAAYGTSIVVGLSRRARKRHSWPEGLLAAIMACYVTAIATIVLQHLPDAPFVPVLERFEYVASLSVGPLLFLYIRSISGHPILRSSIWHSVLPTAALVLPASGGDPLLGMPIQLVMLHQMTYTAASVIERLSNTPERRIHTRLSVLVLVLMSLVHVAQFIRSSWNGVAWLRDVVPLTLSLMLLFAGAAALVRTMSSISSRGTRTPLDRIVPAIEASIPSSTILGRLDHLMESEEVYRDPNVSLRSLADRVDVTPHQLSAELNEVAGISLTDYLALKRLEDVKARLLDPSHSIYSIEGIAGMSGFGSRSSFYAIFKRETGMTPAEFRRHASGS